MLVVVAKDLPPAVRGRMKIWFIEPRPNVFISCVKDAVAVKVIEYLHEHCPPSSDLLIFRKTAIPPGFEIITFGHAHCRLIELSGLQLLLEATS